MRASPELARLRDQLDRDAQFNPAVQVELVSLPSESESGRWVARELQYLRDKTPTDEPRIRFVRAGFIGPHLPHVSRSALADIEHSHELLDARRRDPDEDAPIRGKIGWLRFEADKRNGGAITWSVFTANLSDRDRACGVFERIAQAARAIEATEGGIVRPDWWRADAHLRAVNQGASAPLPSSGWQEAGLRLILGRLLKDAEVCVMRDADTECPLANNPHLAAGLATSAHVMRVHNLAAATVAYIDAHLAPETDALDHTSETHSEDFTVVRWYGRSFQFTKAQADVVRILWSARDDNLGCYTNLQVAERVFTDDDEDGRIDRFRIDKVFKKRKSGEMVDGWGTLIERPSRNQYRLAIGPILGHPNDTRLTPARRSSWLRVWGCAQDRTSPNRARRRQTGGRT